MSRKWITISLLVIPLLFLTLSACGKQDTNKSEKEQLSVSRIETKNDSFWDSKNHTIYALAGDDISIYIQPANQKNLLLLYDEDVKKTGFSGTLQLGTAYESNALITLLGIDAQNNMMSVYIPKGSIINADGEKLEKNYVINLHIFISASEISAVKSKIQYDQFLIYLPKYIIPGFLLLLVIAITDIIYIKKNGKKGELFQEAGKLLYALIFAVIGCGAIAMVQAGMGTSRLGDIQLLLFGNLFALPALSISLFLFFSSCIHSISVHGFLKGIGSVLLSICILEGLIATIGGIFVLIAVGTHALFHKD